MKKKILLVDDEPDIILIVRGRLISWGYDVETVMNGRAALEAVKRQKPDLIVMDVRMPVMSGPEACTQLKTDPQTASIPIILMTASTEIGRGDAFTQSMADDFVLKPFDPAVLLEKIKKYLDPPASV